MKRKEFENYKWYEVTDETYWVDDNPEFPECITIVSQKTPDRESYADKVLTQYECPYGWGTMAKYEDFYFMIIELP
jgi:hypothetical protein